ncbi:MAG: 5-formyltetrahydrofolate cyclo-ligase [Leptolyngbyaceae cyanobacterium bins.349]|nr:5-formyltetrahydrofolate cyclo-ligase [Leptolyngbyaceae cyanobacterium bins.349]
MTDSPSPSADSNKAELRRTWLKVRQSMDRAVWTARSVELCAQLQTFPGFTQAQTILAYFSVRQEPDLSPLFHLPKHWGFPRCQGTELIWHSWSPQDSLPLQKGAFGILEPHPDAPLLAAARVDLILVPAIACDQQGYRLGYGGGFYDRLLSHPAWANKPTIGIVFNFAYLPHLPHDRWDVPLDAVCTESGWWRSA